VGKDDPNKLRELDEKYLRIYGAVLGRAPKEKRIIREEWRGLIEQTMRNFISPSFSPLTMRKNSCVTQGNGETCVTQGNGETFPT